jgi:hypothetical protein
LSFGNATPREFPTAGRVFFEKSAISIDPGNDWLRYYMVGREPDCDLHLRGKGKLNGGSITAVQLRAEITNVQSGVEELRPRTDRDTGLIESSWKEEPFASETGLHGVHASFTQQYPSSFRGGMVFMTQTTHVYLVTNAQSHCVGIRYVSASSSNERPNNIVPGSESEEVQRMIQRTLRAE